MHIDFSDKCVEEEDVDEAHSDVLHNVTTGVSNSVVAGEFGAVSTEDDEAPDGYYLVEFTGLPYTNQVDGLLKCNANWLFPLSRATHWYTNEPGDDTVIDLINVLSTGVVMLPISPSNMHPSQRRKGATKKGAIKSVRIPVILLGMRSY